jgi:hypothetical protein
MSVTTSMKTKNICAITLSLLLSFNTYAMGAKRPNTPAPTPAPTPSPLPAPTPNPPPPSSTIKPTLDFGNSLNIEEFLNVSAEVGPQVDDHENDNELVGLAREGINQDQVDQCFNNSDEESHNYFANQISYYTQLMLDKDVPAKVGFIGSLYGTSSDDNNYFPTSLIRHSLCTVNSSTLSNMMKKVPAQKTIDRLNRFSQTANELRENVLKGDVSSKAQLLSHWTRLFSCLAYTESLGTADSPSSINVANKVAPQGYRKPAGVKFYDDPAQSQESRLNIGMFQFTPNSGGNIQPCLKAWNTLHLNKPQCQINTKSNQAQLVQILGSSKQSFNAFCGIHKLIQTFAIQVNTIKSSSTFPSNNVNGKLKPYEQRCVTPHVQAGKAYNHFGPFQNSTGNNLEELFSCIENSR